jgi:hypothetical protein
MQPAQMYRSDVALETTNVLPQLDILVANANLDGSIDDYQKELFLFSVLTASAICYRIIKEAGIDVKERVFRAISKFKITESISKNYVRREELEVLMEEAFSAKSYGLYNIVHGPKGVGKSKLVDHVAMGKPAVIKISVISTNSQDDLIEQITTILLNRPEILDIESFIYAIEKCTCIPTFIFDVERGSQISPRRTLEAVKSLSKALAPFCRVIIILEEANAVLQFGNDTGHEKFIYVGETRRSEAKQLI